MTLLTYIYSSNIPEGTVLTPSMLLNGFNICEPPHLSLRKQKDENELKLGERYLFLEALKTAFWNMWQNEYLTALFERHSKLKGDAKPFLEPKIGDIVLVKNEKTSRREWKMGRVINLRRTKRDNRIRECTIHTFNQNGKRSILLRSPSFLVPLEIEPEEISDNFSKQYTSNNPPDISNSSINFHINKPELNSSESKSNQTVSFTQDPIITIPHSPNLNISKPSNVCESILKSSTKTDGPRRSPRFKKL